MADKHIVFDALSFGLYVILLSIAGLYLFDIGLFSIFTERLDKLISSSVADVSKILSLLVIIGGVASFIGIMVRLISIIIFQEHHFRDEYRQHLKSKINEIIEEKRDSGILTLKNSHLNTSLQPYSTDAIQKFESDPYFAFVHWQKGQNQIIEWGRYKNRYAYLAENYLVGTFIGLFFLGPTSGLLAGNDYYSATSGQLFWCWASILATFLMLIVLGRFDCIRKKMAYKSLVRNNNDCALCVIKDYIYNNRWLFFILTLIYALPLMGLFCCAKGHNNLEVWQSAPGLFILVGAFVFTISLWTVWYYNRQVEKAMVAIYVASVISNGTVKNMFESKPTPNLRVDLTLDS